MRLGNIRSARGTGDLWS